MWESQWSARRTLQVSFDAEFSPHLNRERVEFNELSTINLGLSLIDGFDIRLTEFRMLLVENHLLDSSRHHGVTGRKVPGLNLFVNESLQFRFVQLNPHIPYYSIQARFMPRPEEGGKTREFAMTTSIGSPRRLYSVDEAQIHALADVLIDCVEGGASVSFMHPLTRDRAEAFWRGVAQGVAAGTRALLVAEDAQGLCGTVQLVFDLPENQPHRADLAKMLVHRRARRQGLGAALMRAAEATARECGKTLLVLDAVTNGDAARLYERLGWVRVGDIPGYALMPRGEPCGTTVFYRNLGP
jgi:GNAT superfamily N-acetyltransferase